MEQAPEAILWIRVIVDSILEAVSPARSPEAARDKRESIRFLTDEVGSWARSRSEICGLVNFCPLKLREKAEGLITRGATRSEVLAMVDGLTRKAQKVKEEDYAA